MLLRFIRQTAVATESRDSRSLEKMLNMTWDLSCNGIKTMARTDPGLASILTLIFRKLNHTVSAILKSVVTLSLLGPDLFRLSGAFKSKARLQNEKINDISSAGVRITEGIQEISTHTQALTEDFSDIEADVSSAIEKGDHSMAGFEEIKAQVEILVETIQVLKENSDSIGSIIDVINGISDETNILSLNARIEATRGRSDGKGFKVIAEEVGNLARQSKEATGDIRGRLNLLGKKISQTVAAANRVAEQVTGCEQEIKGANTALNQVSSRFGRLSGNLSDINEAAAGQADEVRQVSDHIKEMESALGDQASDADSIFSIAEQVNAACDRMILDTGVFHLSGHQRAKDTAQAMAENPVLMSGIRESQEVELGHHLKRTPFIELAYITDSQGRQVTENIYSEKFKKWENLEKGIGRDWSGKEWFKQPAATRKTFVSEVYRSSATKQFCFTVSVPLECRGRFSGVLGIDVNFQDLLDI
ncbi:MAG: hypothetical protein HUN04_10310 [Desulfobacter sp.]|nr:MAG: hypothetical protein HUN04_10310 [Desulfobacter sp.]